MITNNHRQPNSEQSQTTARGIRARPFLAILLVAVLGAGVRLSALLREGGALGSFVDYDEGVYSSAASLMARGYMPYHRFVFTQPPGILYVLGPFGLLSPDRALVAGRFLAVGLGVASIVLVGWIAYRTWGVLPGVVAASIYASFPEVVVAEHGVFLEPALNFFSLAAVACWLHEGLHTDGRRFSRWAIAVGALAAAALAIKLWAIVVVIALLAAPPRTDRARAYRSFAAGIVSVTVLLWLPVVVGGVGHVVNAVFRFQISRPRDGVIGTVERLKLVIADPGNLFSSRHLTATALAVVGLGIALTMRRRERLARIAAIWCALLVVSFVLAAAYYEQYNAALAPAMALLAGCAMSGVMVLLARGGLQRLAGFIVTATVLLLSFVGFRNAWDESLVRSTDLAAVDRDVERLVPDDQCVVSFDPAWLLAANRLPTVDQNDFLAVDPYAAELLQIAKQSGSRGLSATEVFANQPTDDGILGSLDSCNYVLIGWRGRWQLSNDQQARLAMTFERISEGPIDLWERKRDG